MIARLAPSLLGLMFATSYQIVLMVVLGIAGLQLAPAAGLATVPVAAMVIASPFTTLVANRISVRSGRRTALIIGGVLSTLGCLALYAAYDARHFVAFCAACVVVGMGNAFALLYRFATAEMVATEHQAKSHSASIGAGLAASLFAPPVVIWAARAAGLGTLPGSFLMGALFALLALLCVAFHPGRAQVEALKGALGRTGAITGASMGAVIAGVLSIAAMVFLMLAAPLVGDHAGMHDTDVAGIIQLHFIGMYAPGVAAGFLVGRLGVPRLMFAGLAVAFIGVGVGFLDPTATVLMAALFLCGASWGLLIIGSATSVSQSANPRLEQAFNFLSSTAAAVPALTTGLIVSGWGWAGVNWMAAILAVVALCAYGAGLYRDRRAIG